MMRAAVIVCALALAAAVPAAQEPRSAPGPVKKGDTLSVKGCLDGGALQATESEALDATGVLASSLTFRLTGKKDLLKDLREKHDRRVVAITGVLKSDLPREEGQSRSIGRMRITVGGASPSPNSPSAETRRSLPVLEVTSFEAAGDVPCRR